MKINDLISKRFDRLLVLKDSGKRARDSADHCDVLWLCKCDCGNLTEVRGRSLTSGNTKSCGCLQREIQKYGSIIHGEAHKTRLYEIWKDMRRRCFNPHRKPKYYFDRGIQICKDWLFYANFRQWAHKNGYQDNLTIDRINSDGNYEPSNCQWLTLPEHSRKTRIESSAR